MLGAAQQAHPANGADANVDLGDAKQRWREDAQCRGLDLRLFFPENDEGPEAEDARSVCAECPVVADCLAYALSAKESYGVWGGTTPRERRLIRRRSRKMA
jgi:WhiB family redox-sensing transcriptional regulator